MTAFSAHLRAREELVGYWVTLDAPVATERIARLGYDFVCLDAQHGLIGRTGTVAGLTAIAAAGRAAGLVRVEANDRLAIGKALDGGAQGVIVPLVNTPQDVAAAVSFTRFAPHEPSGSRSFAQARAAIAFGPDPEQMNDALCIVMVETKAALDNVEAICRVPGLDGVYVGPADLRLAIGGAYPGDPSVEAEFEEGVARISAAARAAGIAAGFHCVDGASGAERLDQGYTYVSVASDMAHLEAAARDHLRVARRLADPLAGIPSPSAEVGR